MLRARAATWKSRSDVLRARAATWSGCAIFGQCCAQLPARMPLVLFASCSLCFPGTRQLPRLLAVRSSFEKSVAASPPAPILPCALRCLLLQHAALYQRKPFARPSGHTAATEWAVGNATTCPPFCTCAAPSCQNRDLVSRERGKQARRQYHPLWCMVGDAAHWPQQQADASQTWHCASCAFAGHGRCCHGWCTSFTAVSLPRRAGNDIGEAGGIAIAAALKTNTSLTSINLTCKLTPCVCYI